MKLKYTAFRIAFGVLVLQAMGLGANAQTTQLQEVVIEENRLKIPIAQQNRHVTVLDRAQIDRIPANNINELLRFVAGVDIRQRGPFGTQADVSLDGGTFEQTLVLVNGMKMLDAQTGHHHLNLPIPTSAIERIEIIRGPAARKYGINSLTGAINIVTVKPVERALSVHAFGGSGFKRDTSNQALYHGRGVQLGLHHPVGGWNQGLYAGHESGNGYRYNTAFKNHRIWYQGESQAAKDLQFSAMGGYIYNDFGANGFYAAPGDKESREIVQTSLLSVGMKHFLSPRFFWNIRANFRHNEDDYRYFRHDLSRARSQHKTLAYNGELNGALQTTLGTLGLGVEARQEEIQSSNIGTHERQNIGMYAELQFLEWKNLHANAGTYVNYNTDYGWQWFPGIDVGYQFHPAWKVVAHSGTGQRLPSFTDLYLNQLPGNQGNANLLAERSWSIETGLKHRSSRLSAQAYYFLRDINDFIDWVRPGADLPWIPDNFQQNRVQGLSLDLHWQLTDPALSQSWSVSTAYTGIRPDILDPAHASLRSKYGLQTLKNQWISQINYKEGKWGITVAGRVHERISEKVYSVVDTRITYDPGAVLLYLDAQNLTDVTFIEAESVPLPGRWMHLGVKWQLRR